MNATSGESFANCTIEQYWLDNSYEKGGPGTLYVSRLGISWQSKGGAPRIQIITDYKLVKKILTKSEQKKIKLCPQSEDKKAPGVILAFRGPEWENANKYIRECHTLAHTPAERIEASSIGPTSFKPVTSLSRESSAEAAGDAPPVSPRTSKFRDDCFKDYEDIQYSYKVLVENQKVVSEEEFWRERKDMLMIRRAEEDAQSKDRLVQDFDPGFSLRDIPKGKGKGKHYHITDRDIPKIFRLYPWVKKAYKASLQKSDGSETAVFFHEFMGVVDSESGNIKSEDLFSSKFQEFYENYISEESESSRVASKAAIEDVASQVPGKYNLLSTVGDTSNTRAELGFGVHPKMMKMNSARASNKSSHSYPPRNHGSTAQHHINKQSQQALHAFLSGQMSWKMQVYWHYAGEMWSPKAQINEVSHIEVERRNASLFGLAEFARLEAPPHKCNGLGLAAPPQRVIDYTSRLFDALSKISEERLQKRPDFRRWVKIFVGHFEEQFFDKEAHGNGEAEVFGGDVNRTSDSAAVLQHPDFHRSTLFEKDESRFAKRGTINLNSMHHIKRQKLIGGFSVSEKDAAEFAQINSTDCVYKEPQPIVAYQVFRSTMDHIAKHGDPSLVIDESGRASHDLERKRKIFQALVEKKHALTELLRLFWNSFSEGRDRDKCINLAKRVEKLKIGLNKWKESLEADRDIKRKVDTFIEIMRKQIEVVTKKKEQLRNKKKEQLRAARQKDPANARDA